jgi:cytochrome P450
MMDQGLNIDLMDPQVQKCPYDAYETLRRECPVYQMPSTGQYVVSRYTDLQEVLRHPEVFSNQLPLKNRRPGGPNPDVAAVYQQEGWEPTITLQRTDPPQHRTYRQYIDRTFTASRVRKLAPYIDSLVNELIDGFIDDGTVEIVEQFAVPLPCLVIADQFGIAREDAPKLKYWSDAAMEALGLMISPEREVECARIAVEAQHYFAAQFEARQKDPQDDMMSDMVRPLEDGGEPMTMRELLDMMSQLLNGGNQTTTSSLAVGLKLLIENPDQMAQLRADPSLMGNFVEEVLRLETPVQSLFRVVTEDTTLGGVNIPKGAMMVLLYGSANRDEDKFDDEAKFDVCRRNAGAHLAFGAGTHFCPGAMLARQEMISAFTALLARLDNIQFTEGKNSFEFPPSLVHRNLKDLHVTFDRKLL